MLFQSARGDARIGSDGNLLTLAEQDHSRWDGRTLREAMTHFESSIAGDEISEYHVQAAIAAEHSLARDYASTNWTRIAALYEDLLAISPSPVVVLNRAVALAMVEGPESGLREIEAIAGHPQLRNYYLLPATRGELRMRQGDAIAAAADFRRALELPMNEAERRLLHRKLQLCLHQGDSRSTFHPSPERR
jgi:RNA polymerase sigma-70 factor (ECF subfamily)